MSRRTAAQLARDLVTMSITERVLLREIADRLYAADNLVNTTVGVARPAGHLNAAMFHLRQFALQRVIDGVQLPDASQEIGRAVEALFGELDATLRGEGPDL